MSSFCSQRNIVAFNKQREQCTSLSPIVNFFPLIFRSITVGRLMTSVELRFRIRCQSYLFSQWNKHDRNILVFFWRVVSFGYVTLGLCTVESLRCVKFAIIQLPQLELNCHYPVIISVTSLPRTLRCSSSNWDIRKTTCTFNLKFRVVLRHIFTTSKKTNAGGGKKTGCGL